MDSKALILRVLVQCKGSTKKQQGPNKTNNPIMLSLHTYLVLFFKLKINSASLKYMWGQSGSCKSELQLKINCSGKIRV